MREAKRLTKGVLNFAGLGDLGFMLLVNMDLYYWNAFLTDSAKFSIATVAFITTVSAVVDFIWVPIGGAVLQRSNMRWGKYRSWMLISPIGMLIGFMIIFHRFSHIDSLAAGIIITAYGIKAFFQFLCYSASISLVSDLTNNQSERMVMATRRAQYQSLGNIIFSFIALPIIIWGKSMAGNPAVGYVLCTSIFGIANLAIFLIVFKITANISVSGSAGQDGIFSSKEEKAADITPSTYSTAQEEKLSVPDMFSAIFKNPPFMVLLVADTFRYLSYFLTAAAAYYYFVVVLNNLAAMTIFLVVTRFAGLFGASFATICSKIIGKKGAYEAALAIMALSCISCYLWGRSVITFIALQVVFNFMLCMTLALLTAMLADVVIYHEWSTGKDARGFIMSMLHLPIKVGAVLRSVVLNVGLAAAGYAASASSYSATTIKGVSTVMNIYPAIFCCVTFIIFGLGYHLNEKKVEEMTAEIVERKKLSAGSI
jgi:glucuronide carrier protein